MNKHILMAMDSIANPEKYTVEQLRKNCDAAYKAAYKADDAAYAAYVAHVAADAYADYAAAYSAVSCDYERWLNRYFDESGENKQDYINEIDKGYKYE